MTKIKITALLILLLFSVSVFSDAPSDYYDTAEGLTGTSLKSALHNIIDAHTDFGYDNAKVQIFQYIHVRSNYTYCIYSGEKADKTGYPSNDDINCEHLWPQSYGCDSSPMRSDMHHLMPSRMQINSSRSNYPFGWVGAGTTYQNYNDQLYEDDWVGTSETTITTGWCEPRDEVKGDIARALFYMDVRYNGDPAGELDLKLAESGSSGNYQMAKLSVLIEWNNLDPPSPHEMWANDKIYNDLQGNRNPFIDHPEWVCEIWGGSCSSYTDDEPPVFAGIASATATGDTGAVQLSWSAASDDSPPITYNIYRAAFSGGQNLSSPTNTTTSTSFLDSGLVDGITYYYIVRAEDNEGFEETNTVERQATPYVSLGDSIVVYPNPAHGPVTVANLPENSKVSIYTIYGELVESAQPSGSVWIWEAKSGRFTVKSGLYIFAIETPAGNVFKKVAFISGS